MEFKYSTIVESSTYETEGLCNDISLRVHTYPDLADVGALRAQEDWKRFVGPLCNYNGGLGPKYSCMAVSVPECLPDRLGIISYAIEFLFLQSDFADEASKAEGEGEADKTYRPLHWADSTGDTGERKSGKRQIQSKMLSEMIALDRDQALRTMETWDKFVKTASAHKHLTHFATLDEYLHTKVIDIGQMVWLGVITFGMGISITENEADLCAELLRPAWLAVGLTTDLFSWEKDHQETIQAGQLDTVNAIWVLMGEHSITEEEAKLLCKEKIKAAVKEYLQVVAKSCNNHNISLGLRRCIKAVQYRISGNVVWSLQCLRYHPGSQHNQLQLLRMKYGVAAYPTSELDLDAEREATFRESSEKPKRGWKSGLTTPPSPAAEDLSDLDCVKEPAKSYWGNSNIDRAVEFESSETAAVSLDLPELGEEAVTAPYDYLVSLPSKGVRDQVIDALNTWFGVPAEYIEKIKIIGNRLHNSSLMLDDFEDQSPLRRGQPSTHCIFGAAQTVNSANFQIINALEDIRELNNPECLSIFTKEMRSLYTGQSLDLYWTYNLVCPSIPEYIKMVDKKTGGLFLLLSKLMGACSPVGYDRDIDSLTILIGRLYQIRDDYQNLMSKEYTAQKGFCEDLDEGKYSLPLIHALQQKPQNIQLQSILIQRRVAGHMNTVHKQFVLQHLNRSGSLDFTAAVLKCLHSEIIRTIERVERRYKENFSLRLILDLLSV